MALVPIKSGLKLKRPRFLLQPKNPGLDPSQFLSDYLLQNAYLQPSVPFLPDVYKPRPKELNQAALDGELDYFHEEQPNIFNLSHFLWPPHVSDDAEAGTSQTQTTPYIYTRLTNENGEHIWLTEVYSSYAPEHSSEMTYHHYHPESGTSQTLTTPYPYTHPTNEKEELTWPTDVYSPYFPEHSNEMTVVTTTPYSSSISTESTPRIINLPDYNTHYNTETTPTNSASSPYLFWEDEHGYLYLTVPQKGETTVPAPSYSETLESTATTAGDVFYGKITVHPPAPQSPLQRYLELVERLDEGYMLVFLLELCRLVAVKQQRAVRQALYHTESAYNHWWNNGRLFWIEEPLQTVIWKLVVLLSDGDIEVIQTYASMMFHTLLQRRETLSPEVNSILDRADVYYNDEEGQELFKALMEFENYPNTTKSSYSLCDRLIASVLNPFRRRRPHLKLRRKKLMDSINAALNNRIFQRGVRNKEKKETSTSISTQNAKEKEISYSKKLPQLHLENYVTNDKRADANDKRTSANSKRTSDSDQRTAAIDRRPEASGKRTSTNSKTTGVNEERSGICDERTSGYGKRAGASDRGTGTIDRRAGVNSKDPSDIDNRTDANNKKAGDIQSNAFKKIQNTEQTCNYPLLIPTSKSIFF
ncbi:hypothetical protein PYW07_012822 [Mythimna separata]|uniref:Uncharacterized protein n=1 Tax=Mythimna separata TaxID=271217 RepID=A0AAD8DKW7_MYTSE|nr:hypothetical protein PYW07_012822 [Mythimna separata]